MNNFTPGNSHNTVGEFALGDNLKKTKSFFSQGIFSSTLDDLCFKWDLPIPSYIKIDVDGIEHQIINESKKIFENDNVKSLLVEINENRNEDLSIIKFLKKNGYRFDKDQVDKARTRNGTFKGYAEYLFYK